MTRVAVAGAAGRMGRRICELLAETPGLELAGAWEAAGSPAIGQAAGTCMIGGDAAAAMQGADVYIDFTRPGPSLAHLEVAAGLGVAAVIGTTGFDEAPATLFAAASRRIPVLWAPNMSVGVTLLRHLVRQAAAALGTAYDAEIIELHHRWKEDAPSGTAKALLEQVLAGRGQGPDVVRHGREGITGARPQGEVGVHAIRAGEIVGDHTVLLAGAGERIELTHRALSRDPFASGALRAAAWLAGRDAGLYGMDEVLGIGGH